MLEEVISLNFLYSSGSFKVVVVTVVLNSFSLPINLNNSSNFSGDALHCLNKDEILVPFLLQTQQCHGL